jgi:uncharacterized protein YcbX
MHDDPAMSPHAGHVAWIAVAPVKAMALMFLDRATVGLDGIAGDRAFAVLDANGRLVNGKGLGPLATVRASWDPATGWLSLRFPDGSEVAAAVRPGDPIPADIFGKLRPARAVGGPWDEALSTWARRPLHLALMDPGEGIDREGTVSLLGVADLAELAAAGGETEPLDRRRFRMTFGIADVPAYAEDAWIGRTVRLGGVTVQVAGNVGRCAVTTHDPDTGRPSFDTLHVLNRTRAHLPTTEPLPFGVWADVVEPGDVAVGDPVVAGDLVPAGDGVTA